MVSLNLKANVYQLNIAVVVSAMFVVLFVVVVVLGGLLLREVREKKAWLKRTE